MPGEILDCPPCGAELELAGWDQHTGAWCVVNLDAVLSGLDTRGESVLVETQDGSSGRRRRFAETTYDLPYVFSGAVDRHGAAYGDADEGLATNRREFRAQIVTADIITGTLTYPDGVVESGDCIAEHLEWEAKPGALALGVLRLVIPKPWQVTP